MTRTGQLRQLRRMRHRVALQRRGCALPLPWFDTAGLTLASDDGQLPLDGADAVETLAWKASAYPWIREGHLRVRGDRVDVRFLVPRPLARAMNCVVNAWHTEIDAHHPGIHWALTVTEDAPKARERFRLLFRRTSPFEPADPDNFR